MSLIKAKEINEAKLKFSGLAQIDIKDTWQYLAEKSENVAENLIRDIIKKCKFCRKSENRARAK